MFVKLSCNLPFLSSFSNLLALTEGKVFRMRNLRFTSKKYRKLLFPKRYNSHAAMSLLCCCFATPSQ